MSVGLTVEDGATLSRFDARIKKLSSMDMTDLLENVIAEVESQTRRRIQSERRSPEGLPWAAWSERYGKTRHGGHSLLQGEGDLLDSIQSLVTDNAGMVGSNLVYAAVHHHGSRKGSGRRIPARPFLGLSPQNLDEVQGVVATWLEEQTK